MRRRFANGIALMAAIGTTWGCGADDTYPEPPDGTVVTAASPPPPLSGGTLLVTAEGRAVAADPDRDRVWIADLDAGTVREVALTASDEPGRVAAGPEGVAFVALRRGGAIAAIDLGAASLRGRFPVCAAPRGVAYDAATGRVHVACVGGELVSLDATTGEVVRALRLERDLRDVIVDGDRLLVTRFRSGELLALDAAGHEVQRVAQSPLQALSFDGELAPAVAWRAAALPGGGAAIVHQRAALADVPITPGGYSALGHCGGSIVEGTVSLAPPSEAADPPLARPAAAVALPGAILPVDIAVSADGEVAVASAGTDHVMRAHVESIEGARPDECGAIYEAIDVVGEPVAVAYDASGRLVAQTREPPTIQVIGGPRLALPGASVADTGHDMFHKNPNGGLLACASCHPEGGDDGRVWSFDGVGPRRTQNLRGSVMSTAPFHWNGDLHGLDALMSEVFVSRMSGKPQGPRRVRAFGEWLDTIPLVPVSPPDDEAAVARGRALFEDAAVGCATCHGGAALTNAATVDVGTGGAFQVPSLRGLAARAPYMHDGSAESLLDRFGPAGGGDTHGHTSHLDGAALRDLVAYLETL